MEDGVNGVQGLLPALNHNSKDESNREDCEVKEEGFVSTEKVEKVREEDLGKEDCVAKDEAEGGGGGGGLINNLISTLIAPLSPRIGKDTEHEIRNEGFESEEGAAADGGDHRERGGVDNGGEGGLISNLVSNFFHQSRDDGVVETEKEKEKEKEEEEEILVDEKIKRLKTENEANGDGGGIIQNIVSHLPASIPDDAAPTADEATFLINSLVRD
ncbi:hypothetical protein VNO77_20623 [Canavalia gladiata]|uniref:Uncharacterized protein n=1 Tax=Canavalia gladiata TaxID=3824 RepID=A0AAN9QML9_CANGL